MVNAKNILSRISSMFSVVGGSRQNQTGEYEQPLDPQEAKRARLQQFFDEIAFASEEESITEENEKKTKAAFESLCDDMGWSGAKAAFERLLRDKSDKNKYRKLGNVPNWYHEFRPIRGMLRQYMDGRLTDENLEDHGGLEVGIIAHLEHDGYEDFGRSKERIYAEQERVIHEDERFANSEPDDPNFLIATQRANHVGEIVKRVSTHTTVYDEETDSMKKVKFYEDGEEGSKEFHKNTTEYFWSFYIKLADTIENISTLFHHIDGLPTQDAQKAYDYINKKIKSYHEQDEEGLSVFDRALQKYPEHEDVLNELNAMLMVNGAMVKRVLAMYNDDLVVDEIDREPLGMRLAKYQQHAAQVCKDPSPFKSLFIQMERWEAIAADEQKRKDNTMFNFLHRELYPSIAPILGANYLKMINDKIDISIYRDDNAVLSQ